MAVPATPRNIWKMVGNSPGPGRTCGGTRWDMGHGGTRWDNGSVPGSVVAPGFPVGCGLMWLSCLVSDGQRSSCTNCIAGKSASKDCFEPKPWHHVASVDGSLRAEPTDLQLGALAGLADRAARCKSHEVRVCPGGLWTADCLLSPAWALRRLSFWLVFAILCAQLWVS